MLSSIFGNVSNITRNSALRVAALSAAVSFTASASAQTSPPPAPPAAAEEEEAATEEAEEEAVETEEETEGEEEGEEEEGAEPATSSKLVVETGAPRPPAQTPGIAPAVQAPSAPPPPPTIKVGGGFILAYFQPYNMGEEARRQNRPRPESNFETFRAAILLDSKIDRFGVHMEFRARDKKVREFFESTAWLEEIYGSVDIMKSDNPLGQATLKVGKSFSQFGRFWDDSFYGNVHLRDGLKLDSNYGLSLEGQIGRGKYGAKYFGQYFILDGGTNTSLNNRDTISNPAPVSGHTPLQVAGNGIPNTAALPATPPAVGVPVQLARRRNMFVGRVEPFVSVTPTTTFKIGGSIQNFTADYGPTKKQENVLRYGGDVTASVAWFSAWAEYTKQKGHHTLNYPFAGFDRPDPTGSSNDTDYLLAGGRFFYKGMMLRYNFSAVKYHDVNPFSPAQTATARAVGIMNPVMDVTEKMHVPGIMISATQQLFLFIEAPVHKRYHSKNLQVSPQAPPAARALNVPDFVRVIDRSIVVTLHARI